MTSMVKSIAYKNKHERTQNVYFMDDIRKKKYAKLLEIIISEAQGLSNVKLLEVGCGTGLFSRDIPGEWEYTGTSLREKEILFGACNDINIVEEDIVSMSFKDGSFDIIVCVHTIEYVSSQDLAIKELLRVLKKGGLLYIFYDACLDKSRPYSTDYFAILSKFGVKRLLEEFGGCMLNEGDNMHISGRMSDCLFKVTKK